MHKIEAPPDVVFPMCAVADEKRVSFDIINSSELDTSFTIECEEPFSVEPSEGLLKPKSRITLTVAFRPKVDK